MIKFYSCLIGLVVLSGYRQHANAQEHILPKGNYLVVAAYFSNQEDFAQRYAAKLNESGRHSTIGFDAARKFYYVYVDQYSDFNESVQQMLKLRKEGQFDNVWVRVIKDGAEPTATTATVEKKEEPAVKTIPASTNGAVKNEPVKTELIKKEEVKPEEVKPEEVKPAPAVTEVVPNPPAKPVYVPQTLKNTQVFLSLYNMTNKEVLDGDIEVVDTERSRLITKVKGNTYISLPNPGTKSGQLTLISNVFGFRKDQLELNYKNTEADTLKPYVALVGNYYMVNFGLARIHKGDISTLYNVYFYNDAAIMLPESKYQLNSLLNLMQENPKLKIKLHGHTNGNGHGKIIYMGPSKDFFTLTNDVKNGSGSAKELSEARANTIREWLIAQGISENRVAVKGWGGSRMIHDKNSTHARKNIRVDVEVLED
ncbi:MAG: OmpA family protein [Bacteroidetes bacterium]|nr:OmpA family protein [Bacteroidota bacterium]MBS1541006.1 OmpA family protein [Bacteroidota bacterium]